MGSIIPASWGGQWGKHFGGASLRPSLLQACPRHAAPAAGRYAARTGQPSTGRGGGGGGGSSRGASQFTRLGSLVASVLEAMVRERWFWAAQLRGSPGGGPVSCLGSGCKPAQHLAEPCPRRAPGPGPRPPWQGLPVFHAPGEAEAVCAALAAAGCVDAVATFDSDALLYGAETVYQTLKLSVSWGSSGWE